MSNPIALPPPHTHDFRYKRIWLAAGRSNRSYVYYACTCGAVALDGELEEAEVMR